MAMGILGAAKGLHFMNNPFDSIKTITAMDTGSQGIYWTTPGQKKNTRERTEAKNYRAGPVPVKLPTHGIIIGVIRKTIAHDRGLSHQYSQDGRINIFVSIGQYYQIIRLRIVQEHGGHELLPSRSFSIP
jgi:hypothetical protein